jgi:tetratricopeptide (TPR) repeat protein
MRTIFIEDIQELITSIGQSNNYPGGMYHQEGSIQKMFADAVAAYDDFRSHGSMERLEQAISQWQIAVETAPENHPALPGILNGLAISLLARFEQLGHPADLDEAIERLRVVIKLTPEDDPNKPTCLTNLGGALGIRFHRLGGLQDLDETITKQQEAVDITPYSDPKRPGYLNNLGTSLRFRFQRFGNLADIDSAIAQGHEAVDLTSDDHPDKPMFLVNLGSSLDSRFERFGNIADIDSGVQKQQMAVNLTPNDHPNKPGYLSDLGSSLGARFERLGDLADVENAIMQQQRAVDLTSDDHRSKASFLNKLGHSLTSRFRRLENIVDLDNAILQYQLAVNLTPDDNHDMPIWLNNLGGSLYLRFKQCGNLGDLNEAIKKQQLAVDLTSDDHPRKPGYLNNLSASLEARFNHLRNVVDMDNAISQLHIAINLIPHDHPARPGCLFNLGTALIAHFDHLHRPQDAEAAISHLSAAAMSQFGPPTVRFDAAEIWISIASRVNHDTLLAAYKCALGLVPLVAWLGLPLADRHQHLIRIGGIAREAAAAAISLEQYDKALEWLEQGRSIVWTQILRLRTPVDQLRDSNPVLAERLLQVSRQLDRGSQQTGLSERNQPSKEEEGRQYRALVAEWESITEQVRSFPGFESFLQPLSSSRLKKAAENGPIIVVNIAEKRCDALALLPDLEEVIHIPLRDISFERVTELRDELKDQLYSKGIRMRGERAAKKMTDELDEDNFERVLGELWINLVKPVIDSLAFSVSSPHYCPFFLLTIIHIA